MVAVGDIMIQFPPLPQPPAGSRIVINNPQNGYPVVTADPTKQKPIVFVPELVYPHKVKRVIVHHENPI